MDAVPAIPLLPSLLLLLLLLGVAAALALLLLDELLAHVLLLPQPLLGGWGAHAGVGAAAVLGHAKGEVGGKAASSVGGVGGGVTAEQARGEGHRRGKGRWRCKCRRPHEGWLAGQP